MDDSLSFVVNFQGVINTGNNQKNLVFHASKNSKIIHLSFSISIRLYKKKL